MIGIILAITVAAGIVQGITGFGSGIVMMMVFPYFFATIPTAAGVSAAISIVLNLLMVKTYHDSINFKKIVPPAILYIIVCSVAIKYATIVDQALMKKVFGVFLLILAIYYLFIDKGEKRKLGLAVSVFCIVVSAVCDGFFGIGGPLMVLYFLSKTHSTHEYLGTIQTFFCINCCYNTALRFYNGILLPEHFIYIALGMVGIIVGGLLANKIVNKLDGMIIRKLTYVMIGVSGLLNLF